MTHQVVMIDDNEDDLLFTRIVLGRSGCPVDTVEFTSAQDALQHFADQAPEQRALVLLDINMPGMSGFDFLEAYETLPQSSRQALVVVMLTSSIDDRDRERALRFPSVKGFANKPLDKAVAAELLKMLDT